LDREIVPVVEVQVLPGYYTNSSMLGLNSTVIKYDPLLLVLQVDFDHPEQFGRYKLAADYIQVTINDANYFKSMYGTNVNNTVLIRQMPIIY
jgi:hypothetical protein